ncbi:MAG: hypothetical protein ABI959_00290, partial [Candidatus Dormiibacterota bacterium]
MASDLTLPQPAGADSPFGVPTAASAARRGSTFLTSWRYPLITSIAAAVIIGAVALRMWEANLPRVVLQEEGVLLAFGVAYGAVAVAIRTSRWSGRVSIQLGLMAVNVLLAVAVLGVAAPWLGNDLMPLSATLFATMLLYFDLGFLTRHFLFVVGIAGVGLAVLWFDAAVMLHLSTPEVISWALVLL